MRTEGETRKEARDTVRKKEVDFGWHLSKLTTADSEGNFKVCHR